MEMTLLAGGLTAALSYLLGSISFAVIVCRLYAHDDIRKYGSHNAGMTNVLRVYGPVPAVFTLLGDFFKGVAAVVIGRWLFEKMGVTGFDAGYVAGVFALLGHLFPVYFGFKGGKGVLTSMGIMLAVNPVVLVILLAVLLPVLCIVKIVSLVSILGALMYPIVTYMVRVYQGLPPLWDTLFSMIFSVVVIFMHRENIKRLINGTERRIGDSKPRARKGEEEKESTEEKQN